MNWLLGSKDKEAATGLDPLTPTSSVDDILAVLLRMSSGCTTTSVLAAVKKLPVSKATDRIGFMAVGSAMSAKKAMEPHVKSMGIADDPAWKIKDGMNFTMFVMLGHFIMVLDEHSFTEVGQKLRKAYIKTIGGSANIVEYGVGGSVKGKDERTQLLKKWVGLITKNEVFANQDLLASKFPSLVKPASGYIWRTFGIFGRTIGRTVSAIRAVLSLPFYLMYPYFLTLAALQVALYVTPEFTTQLLLKVLPSPSGAIDPYWLWLDMLKLIGNFFLALFWLAAELFREAVRDGAQVAFKHRYEYILAKYPTWSASVRSNAAEVYVVASKFYRDQAFPWLNSTYSTLVKMMPDNSSVTTEGVVNSSISVGQGATFNPFDLPGR